MEYHVTIYNRSMNDFVTSNRAVMVFSTREEADDYIESSEKHHPGRFLYGVTPVPSSAEGGEK